jgi:cholest-4-en-3-one 26-monooxygenase
MAPPLSLDTLDIIGPDHYQRGGYPHAEWAYLRKHAPVHWYTRAGGTEPFWAITKHADVIAISKQPRLFVIAPRLAVFPDLTPPEGDAAAHHLLTMDPPEHGDYRRLVSAWFTPRTVQRLAPGTERIAQDLIAELEREGLEGEIDFVERVAAVLPLAVIADMLGSPRSDWKQLFRWTNEAIGPTDPEFQRPGERPEDTSERARTALFGYFVGLVEERRRAPRDDIISVLANARLDGKPLGPRELLSYFFLLVVAGNETTRNATSGGLWALIQNPGELEKLKRDPSLVDSAVEEIVRWTTPVIQFTRTATEDTEIRGQKIRAGEAVCMFYPSANRDEDVFEAPFSFRVDRNPNPHLAFGIGEHVCLGQHLARLELRVIFKHLARRLDCAELCGEPARLRSSFVGGIKHLPIRYRLRPASAPDA